MTDSTPHSDAPKAGDDTEVQDVAAKELSQSLSLRSLQTPGAIPGYQIEQCLGEGSFGSVWLARESRTGKKVAIKFYARGRGVDWSLLSREVEKLAVLYTARNIVRLLDVAWDHDPPYFVMEYLEKGSLAQLLERGPLPVDEAVRIAKSMGQALVHAHGSGVLHCDLKPANVLFDAGGEARLCDFGQSRLSSERTPALGTLFYMAPEQAVLDGVPDARWDVYALGALLYQMLTGHAPGRQDGTERVLRQAGTMYHRSLSGAAAGSVISVRAPSGGESSPSVGVGPPAKERPVRKLDMIALMFCCMLSSTTSRDSIVFQEN